MRQTLLSLLCRCGDWFRDQMAQDHRAQKAAERTFPRHRFSCCQATRCLQGSILNLALSTHFLWQLLLHWPQAEVLAQLLPGLVGTTLASLGDWERSHRRSHSWSWRSRFSSLTRCDDHNTIVNSPPEPSNSPFSGTQGPPSFYLFNFYKAKRLHKRENHT